MSQLAVTVEHLGLVRVVELQRLGQSKNMFCPVIAHQRGADRLNRGMAAHIAIGRQHIGIALARYDRSDDPHIAEKDGRLPINPSGGLKSKGHPVGATGVSMHVMACLQLMNEAGDMQIGGATLTGVFNMGGAAVANYVSILERAK